MPKSNKNSNYYMFNYNGNKYILDYLNIYYGPINDEYYEIFKTLDQSKEIKETLLENSSKVAIDILNLYENGIFFSEDRKLVRNINADDAFISFAPIHDCNLRCEYCFANHGKNYKGKEKKITKINLEVSIRFLYSTVFKLAKRIRIDFVSGGEPLLAFDNIREITNICNKLDKEFNKKTSFWLCTNGTIYNNDVMKFLNDNDFNIGISLDGDKLENDKNRIYKNKKSTYNRVVKNIQLIKNNTKLTNKFKNIWILTVITKKTDSLIKIIEHHKKIGIRRLQMKIVRTCNKDLAVDKNSIKKIIKLYEDLLIYFMKDIKNDDISSLEMILNDNDYFGKIIRRLILRMIVANRCQAGKNKLALTANGDLYPCDSFVGEPDFCIGNAVEGKINSKEICDIYCEDRKECNKCWARYICGGDCFHNSYLKNDCITQPDEIFCELQKKLIEFSVVLLAYMNINKPDIFNALQKRLMLERKVI